MYTKDYLRPRVAEIREGDVYRANNPRSKHPITVIAIVKNEDGGERIECVTAAGKKTLVDPFRLSKNTSRGYVRETVGTGGIVWSR